jgi:hypothetical protein
MRSDRKFTRAAHIIKISSNSFKDATGTVPLKILNTLSLRMALTSRNNFVHSKKFITIHQLTSSKISNRYYTKTLSNTYMYNICIHVNESGLPNLGLNG